MEDVRVRFAVAQVSRLTADGSLLAAVGNDAPPDRVGGAGAAALVAAGKALLREVCRIAEVFTKAGVRRGDKGTNDDEPQHGVW